MVVIIGVFNCWKETSSTKKMVLELLSWYCSVKHCHKPFNRIKDEILTRSVVAPIIVS